MLEDIGVSLMIPLGLVHQEFEHVAASQDDICCFFRGRIGVNYPIKELAVLRDAACFEGCRFLELSAGYFCSTG